MVSLESHCQLWLGEGSLELAATEEVSRAEGSPPGFHLPHNGAETHIEHCRAEARLAGIRFASSKDHYVSFEERRSSVSE